MSRIELLVAAFGLASLRYLPPIALPAFTPLRWAPPLIRSILAIGLAWLTVLALPQQALEAIATPGFNWVLAALGELAIGLAFGAVLMFPQAALNFAGWLVDVQAGLGAATLFNPGGQGEAQSMIGAALGLLATVLFFLLDLHLELYRALVASSVVLPLGHAGVRLDAGIFLGLLGSSFLLGLMVVLPVVAGLFAVDVGVAYATRSMPQANVYFLVLPLKIIVALLLMIAVLPFVPALLQRLYQDAFARVPVLLGA
jgi:flagellar biosynthetic protein FliR